MTGITLRAGGTAAALLALAGLPLTGCGGSRANGGASSSVVSPPAAAPLPPAGKVAPETLSKLDDYAKRVVQLGGKPELHLDLSYSKVTDNDLADLEILAMVTSMNLSFTGVTDAGIGHLRKYPQLERLTIIAVPLTDASVEHFKAMPKLWQVEMNQVKISREGQLDLMRVLSKRAQEVTRARDKRISQGPGGPR